MELVNQHTKRIMEGCKERARSAGLRFEEETLEYIVTNRDLIELTPKYMIPTLYDYWVHDVEVLKEKGRYELYPNNPYETVINTRPAISYYNDNNPDWLNVMIFYHVLAHIDFFQNNLFFQHTWDDDFCGRALSDKRTIARLRNEKGRWADYVIEFSRSLDNLVGYYALLSKKDRPTATLSSKKLDYYFDIFLQSIKRVKTSEYLKEIDHYNDIRQRYDESADQIFFSEVNNRYPEFEAFFNKSLKGTSQNHPDPVEYILEHSEFLNREENRWMKLIVQIVRDTSLFFQPQIRTKIMNEGWASFWHEKLFLSDDRIRGHEVDFALVNAKVISLPRVGLNPYALGMRLFGYIEEMADRGCYDWTFDRLSDELERSHFDRSTGKGREVIFEVRKYLNDFQFITRFVDQAFVDRHRLFVVEERLDEQRMVWQYIVKSRKAQDYRQMVIDSLYHPPCIEIPPDKQERNILYLDHRFEGKQLVTEFIPSVLIGISYLWGGPVKLETSEWLADEPIMSFSGMGVPEEGEAPPAKWKRVLYTMTDRKLTKTILR